MAVISSSRLEGEQNVDVSEVYKGSSGTQNILESNHNCAVIKQADLRPQIVAYKGMEIIAVKSSLNSQAVAAVQQQIMTSSERNVVVKQEGDWAIIQYYTSVSSDKNKGYYVGNQ